MPTSRPPRGALARRCKGGMGCGACGRGLRKPRTRAASGLRPAGHYEPPARSSLTTGIAGESAARRRDKNAAVERRKASALRQGRAADAVKHAQTAQACLLAAVGAPLGAPLPSASARGKEQTSGAKMRRENDGAWNEEQRSQYAILMALCSSP